MSNFSFQADGMTISQLIDRLQRVQSEHGDLPVFDADTYLIRFVAVDNSIDVPYPKDWNMPEKFLRLGVLK